VTRAVISQADRQRASAYALRRDVGPEIVQRGGRVRCSRCRRLRLQVLRALFWAALLAGGLWGIVGYATGAGS